MLLQMYRTGVTITSLPGLATVWMMGVWINSNIWLEVMLTYPPMYDSTGKLMLVSILFAKMSTLVPTLCSAGKVMAVSRLLPATDINVEIF